MSDDEFRQRIGFVEAALVQEKEFTALPAPPMSIRDAASLQEAMPDALLDRPVADAAPAMALVEGMDVAVTAGQLLAQEALVDSTGHPAMEVRPNLRNVYLTVLQAAITAQWQRSTGDSGTCSLTLLQEAGGKVLSAQVQGCELDMDERNALEAAALMAQPLPYAGYESVFEAEITLDFGSRSR